MAKSKHIIIPHVPALKPNENPLFSLIREVKAQLKIDPTYDDIAGFLFCSASAVNSYFSGSRKIPEDKTFHIAMMISYGLDNLFEVVYPDGQRKTPPEERPKIIRKIQTTPLPAPTPPKPQEYVQLSLF